MLRIFLPIRQQSIQYFASCFNSRKLVDSKNQKYIRQTHITPLTLFHTSPSIKFERKNPTNYRSFEKSAETYTDDIDFEELFNDEEYDAEEQNSFNFGRDRFRRQEEDNYGINLDDVKSEFDQSAFQKNFYEESPITNNRSEEEKNRFYSENSIEVSGKGVPQPIFTFDEINLPVEILDSLRKNNITQPTPVQSVTWPATLSGRNVIGIAQTGSGKTLSFLLPALIHIDAQSKPGSQEGPIALVLCPTRELAKQCEKVARTFFSRKLRTTCLFGGGERRRQIDDLNIGCDLVVATPGRLMDLLSERRLALKRCTFLVLDEADRMLDMGFEPQIRKIIDLIRPDRQVTMWSATWPKEVRDLASQYLSSDDDPVRICIGSSELTANCDVEQKFLFCADDNKKETFFKTVNSISRQFKESGRTRQPKMLVFCNRKATCDQLAIAIKRAGMKAEAIHGDIAQTKRDYIMKGFRGNFFPVLVATDVAARGLDVDNINYVINYDAPLNSVTYIHRIGRTGRAGNKGTSITILSQMDGGIVGDIIDNLRAVDQPVDESLLKMEAWWKKQRSRRKSQQNSPHGFGYDYRRSGNYISNKSRPRNYSSRNEYDW